MACGSQLLAVPSVGWSLSLSLSLSLSIQWQIQIQVTGGGGHKTKPAQGGGGGAVSPQRGWGQRPEKFWNLSVFKQWNPQFPPLQQGTKMCSKPLWDCKMCLVIHVHVHNIWRYGLVRRGIRSRSRPRKDMYDWDRYDHEILKILWLRYVWLWDIYDWNMWLRWLKYVWLKYVWLKYVWSWDMYEWGMFSHWRQDLPGACAWNVLWQTCWWPCHGPGECLCAQITASGHSSDLPALCSVDRTLHSRLKSCLTLLSLSWPAAPAERWGWS